jgi:AcrR family transcriptional regulator
MDVRADVEVEPRVALSGRSSEVREAALTLFAERGYHGTTMAEIAQVLGIRTPSLYNHIRSKQELLRDVMVETTDQVLEEFEQAVAGGGAATERLRRAVHAYVLRHTTHRREALIVNRDVSSLLEPARSEVLEKRRAHEHGVRALIEEGNREGTFSAESPALASFAILEMCVSVARWFREGGPLSAASVARQYSEFAVRLVGSGARSPDA